jgi:hypothetical protein
MLRPLKNYLENRKACSPGKIVNIKTKKVEN